MKVSPKYTSFLMALIISIGMSFIMSFVMTSVNIGFPEHFFLAWLRSWGVGFAVGLPTATLIVPIARRIVFRFTAQGPPQAKP